MMLIVCPQNFGHMPTNKVTLIIDMPYKTTKLKGGKVRVTSPNGVKSKGSTPANAKRQVRLLNAIEHDPDFKPREAMKKRVLKGGY